MRLGGPPSPRLWRARSSFAFHHAKNCSLIGPKMAFRESTAGTRFEILLKRHGCVLSDKCKVRDHKPRSELCGMRGSSILVIYQSLLEITRQTNVSLVRGGFRLQNVDVIHS